MTRILFVLANLLICALAVSDVVDYSLTYERTKAINYLDASAFVAVVRHGD